MAVEDFTTYTEVESATATITIDANTITATKVPNDEINYVYKDKDAAHFNGDFEHLVSVRITLTVAWIYHGGWALANAIGDLDEILDASGDYLSVNFKREATTAIYLFMQELDGGVAHDSSNSPEITLNTWYFLRIKRVEADGDYGTLYCDIYTSAADRTNEENAFANLSLALHTSKKDFQYIYGFTSYSHDVNGNESSFQIEDLDLQESAGGTVYYQSADGAFAPTGILVKNTKTAKAGNFTLTGIITKKGFVPKAGAVTFSGAAVRLPKKGLAGVVTFAGSLGTHLLGVIQQAVGGVLTFVGALGRFRGLERIVGILTRLLTIRNGGISRTTTVRGTLTRSITVHGRIRR